MLVIRMDGGGQKDTSEPRPKAHRPVYIGDLYRHTDLCRRSNRPSAMHAPQYKTRPLPTVTNAYIHHHRRPGPGTHTIQDLEASLHTVRDVCTQSRSRYTQAQRPGSTPMHTREQTRVHAAGHTDPFTLPNRHTHPGARRTGHADACTCQTHILSDPLRLPSHTHNRTGRTGPWAGARTVTGRGARARARTHTHTI